MTDWNNAGPIEYNRGEIGGGMIVRITFVGIVKSPSDKKKGYRDHIDLHVGSVADAKKIWESWCGSLAGYLPGASGIIHPIGNGRFAHGVFGELKAESFEEAPEEDE